MTIKEVNDSMENDKVVFEVREVSLGTEEQPTVAAEKKVKKKWRVVLMNEKPFSKAVTWHLFSKYVWEMRIGKRKERRKKANIP